MKRTVMVIYEGWDESSENALTEAQNALKFEHPLWATAGERPTTTINVFEAPDPNSYSYKTPNVTYGFGWKVTFKWG